jgi:hypothetical protein
MLLHFQLQIAVCEEKDLTTERQIAKAANRASHLRFELTYYDKIVEIKECMEEVHCFFKHICICIPKNLENYILFPAQGPQSQNKVHGRGYTLSFIFFKVFF